MVNRPKLIEKSVREAENLLRDYQVFDSDVRGFSITICPSGNRAFTLDYRVGGRQQRMTSGAGRSGTRSPRGSGQKSCGATSTRESTLSACGIRRTRLHGSTP